MSSVSTPSDVGLLQFVGGSYVDAHFDLATCEQNRPNAHFRNDGLLVGKEADPRPPY